MEARRFFTMMTAIAVVASIATGMSWAAVTITGTVISAGTSSISIKADGDGTTVAIKPGPTASIVRGQMGKEARKAKLVEFGAGDRIVAVVNDKGVATSVKGFYAIAKGTMAEKRGDKVFFKDGRCVNLRPNMPIVFDDGKLGTAADLAPGCEIVCRVNPVTSQAWTVIAKKPKVIAVPEIEVAPVKPDAPLVKPVIKTVAYNGPENLKAKDWVRVDLVGTPGGRAICQVKGLIPRTEMKEIEPGSYRAQVMVPSGKLATNEPLVGYLTLNGLDAAPVQAAKLVTVAAPSETLPAPAVAITPEPEPVPEPVVAAVSPAPVAEPAPALAPEPTPAPAPVDPPKPEPPKAKPPVVVTAPTSGDRILRTITVTGTADPGANVMVTVTYSNQMGGILNLSGQVSSQLVAVNPLGEFKMGPIALEGPLATKGLIFTVKAAYPDAADQVVQVSVFGDRS